MEAAAGNPPVGLPGADHEADRLIRRQGRLPREPRPGRVRKQVHANETPYLGFGFHGGCGILSEEREARRQQPKAQAGAALA